MGKKKAKSGTNNPDAIKELGNKAFTLQKYDEAIQYYTQAIELTLDNPNHVYFANRANSKLETFDFQGCIDDCDQAIKIDKNYIKSYLRKAKALQALTRFQDGLDTVKTGLEIDPENAEFKEMEGYLNEEIKFDNVIAKDHPERVKIDKLIDCMHREGAEFSKIRLRFYESTHRGAHAACNIKLNDIILKIPEKAIITEYDAMETPVGKKMGELNIGDDDRFTYGKHNIMSAFMLTEIYKKREDPNYVGKFDEFLAILPANTDDFPAFYTEEELSLLKGSVMFDWANQRKQHYQEDYDLICKLVPEFKQFNFEDYKYTNILSSSRTFDLQIRGKTVRTMCPFADMMNHKNPTENSWYFDGDTNCFQVRAQQNIPFGAPILYSYGTKNTASLFLNYGFVLHPHDLDEKPLYLEWKPPHDDIHYETKAQLCSNLAKWFDCSKDLNKDEMQCFIGFARWVVFDDVDTSLMHLERTKKEEPYLEGEKKKGVDIDNVNDPRLLEGVDKCFKGYLPKSKLDNEIKAWSLIKQVAEKSMNEYPSTLQEDIDIIKKDETEKKLSFNQTNCILYRKGEKEILQYLIDCCDKANELSKLSSKEAKQQINHWVDFDKRGLNYFREQFCELLP